MSDRNETTESRQLAEMAAVDIVGKRNLVANPLTPIKWIRSRKVKWLSDDKSRVLIKFLFQIDDETKSDGFYLMTAVTVLLTREDKNKKWNLVSAKLESEYQPPKPNIEMWEFLPDGISQKVG